MSTTPMCGAAIANLSLDYLFDLASVMNIDLTQRPTLCGIYQPTYKDTNARRGELFDIYISDLQMDALKRAMNTFLMALILIVLIVIYWLSKYKKNGHLTFSQILIPFIIAAIFIFIQYCFISGGCVKPDPSLRRLRERARRGLSPKEVIYTFSLLPEDYFIGFQGIWSAPNYDFPIDHSLRHYEFPTEWYWYVSLLKDVETSDLYSVELMFCRSTIIPPALAARLGIPLEELQICEVINVIGSEKDNAMYQARICDIPSTSGMVGFGLVDPFIISVGENILSATQPPSLFPMSWIMSDPSTKTSTRLQLTPLIPNDILYHPYDPPVLQGTGIGTYYYSFPQLNITGSLMINGEKEISVIGTGWIDHQLFAGLVPIGRIPNTLGRSFYNTGKFLHPSKLINGGWDYLICQLFTKEVYIFWRGLEGVDLKENNNISLTGVYADATGKQQDITGTGTILSRTAATSLRSYTAPNSWKIVTSRLTMSLKSIVTNGFMSVTRGELFECAAPLTDVNGTDIGTGWIENVGYGDPAQARQVLENKLFFDEKLLGQ